MPAGLKTLPLNMMTLRGIGDWEFNTSVLVIRFRTLQVLDVFPILNLSVAFLGKRPYFRILCLQESMV